MICPYCGQSEISERSRTAFVADLSARAVCMLRNYYEARTQEGWGLKRIGELVLRKAKLPEPDEYDRICPYCRKGLVTRESRESLMPDLIARGLGAGRRYVELKKDREGFGFWEMCAVAVEGEDVDFDAYDRVAARAESEAAQSEHVETTPFDE